MSRDSDRPGPPEEGLLREATVEYRVNKRISATEAARNFSEILNRVRYRGESFVIERGGVAIGELRPVSPQRFTSSDFLSLMKSVPPVDDEFLELIESQAREQPGLPESPWER